MNAARSGLAAVLLAATLWPATAAAQAARIDYLDARPLADRVTGAAQPVRSATRVPLITWGGDVHTVLAELDGLFTDDGLDVELFVENNFAAQVEGVLRGETPYLRGTVGMINAAVEVFERAGVELVVIYQMTWSTGGDTLVAREDITSPSDLRGKTIALQLDGPHMDYVAAILANAGVPLDSVTFKWLRELTLPEADTASIVDPVSAFVADDGIDAVMAIVPDALLLTSGGAVGTGAEGSVAGAHVLLTTATMDRAIADVYAVRKDYFDAHRDEVERFTHALMRAQERLATLLESAASNQARYQQVLARSADLLLGSPTATGDVEALLADCTFVGHPGNVAFFTGRGTTRNIENMTAEIQRSFRGMGLLNGTVPLAAAGWDFDALGRGLTNVAAAGPAAAAREPRFDRERTASAVERRITAAVAERERAGGDLDAELSSWEDGTLFVREINFDPNQSTFSVSRYADDFREAVNIAQTNGGALIVIEGHSDPLGVARARQDGRSRQEIDQMVQSARNLALQRSRQVFDSFLAYCEQEGLVIDESQFVTVGMGIDAPKFYPPRTAAEWEANRRVVFRIRNVEAELSEFTPLDGNP